MLKDNKLKKSLLFILTISTLILGSYSIMNKKVMLTVDGQTMKVKTLSRTVQSFLINKNIKVESGSRIIPDLNSNIKNNMSIKVINPYEIKISNGGKNLIYKTNQEIVEDILKEFNIKLSSKDIINKKLDEIVKPNDEIIITRVKEEVDTQVLEIPCEVEYIEDASLLEGQTKEHIKGENGKLEIKYRITYKNGVPIKKQKISEVILIEPIKQIVKKGILKADTI
jgi:uncharacterized protein YabE (DUF348 family)